MSDFYTPPPPPPPPPPPYGGGGNNPPPPPPPGGGYGGPPQGGPYGPNQGGPYQGGPGYRETPGGPGYPGPGGPGYPPPPKKRGMLPWILGCGGCGLLIVIALAVFGGIGYVASLGERARAGSDTTAAAGGAGDEAGTTLYAATEEGLSAHLRDKFVPFSFRYPEGWTVVERGDADDSQNFVKVERSNGGTTAENFAVGYLTLPAGQEDNRELLGQLLTQLEQQLPQQFAGFQRVGDDRLTLDGRQATGFRFTAQQGEIKIFGRVLLLPLGDGRGLSIIMLGTPVQSGLESLDDLGEKGGLPVILRSFRAGENAEGAGAAKTPAEGKPSDGSAEATPGDESAAQTSDEPSDDAPAQDGETDIQEIKPLKP